LPKLGFAGLSSLPDPWDRLFRHDILVWLVVPIAILLWWTLERTRWGLRLRATGEDRNSAYVAGLHPPRLQYQALAIAGCLSGIGGTELALGFTKTWQEFIDGRTRLHRARESVSPPAPTGTRPPCGADPATSASRSTDHSGRSTLQTSLVQAFDEHGEGLILRGQEFEWDPAKEGSRSPHLTEELSGQLVDLVLDRYETEMGTRPIRVVVQKSSRYWPGERVGFGDALRRRVARFDLLALDGRQTHIRLSQRVSTRRFAGRGSASVILISCTRAASSPTSTSSTAYTCLHPSKSRTTSGKTRREGSY
jgi:hypothetical protein